MLSNNGLCLRVHSCAVCVTIFSNGSIIPPGFKFTKLHALTLAARSYALLCSPYNYICLYVNHCNSICSFLHPRLLYGIFFFCILYKKCDMLYQYRTKAVEERWNEGN